MNIVKNVFNTRNFAPFLSELNRQKCSFTLSEGKKFTHIIAMDSGIRFYFHPKGISVSPYQICLIIEKHEELVELLNV